MAGNQQVNAEPVDAPLLMANRTVIIDADLTNEQARASLLVLGLQERKQVGIDLVRINSAHPM